MKNIFFLLPLLAFTNLAHADNIFTGKEMTICSKQQDMDKCMESSRESSEKKLSSVLNDFYKAVKYNHDDSYNLDDQNTKKSDVYIKYFEESQKQWVLSRDNFCNAIISASGSYALHSTPTLDQCIINMNKRRVEEINLAGEF